MAGASDLFDAIDAYRPAGWDWSGGTGARQWMDALCTGFVSMWAAGTLLPYTWPGVGPQVHTHTITVMSSSVMLAPLTALGYSGADLGSFFSDICGAVATYVQSNTTFATAAVAVTPHTHSVASAGSGSALKSAILGAISIGGSDVDSIINAIANGIVDFVAANGLASLSVPGNPHTHVLAT